MNINEWAQRWNIPVQALDELLAMPVPDSVNNPGTEAAISQDIRLAASYDGNALWRNNSGAVTTDDGRHIRFGLGNDSIKINKTFKSSDLIGPTPKIIDANMIGKTVGIFTAIEVKPGNWKWLGTEREKAQWNYLQLVNRLGGFSTFAKSVEDYKKCISAHA